MDPPNPLCRHYIQIGNTLIYPPSQSIKGTLPKKKQQRNKDHSLHSLHSRPCQLSLSASSARTTPPRACLRRPRHEATPWFLPLLRLCTVLALSLSLSLLCYSSLISITNNCIPHTINHAQQKNNLVAFPHQTCLTRDSPYLPIYLPLTLFPFLFFGLVQSPVQVEPAASQPNYHEIPLPTMLPIHAPLKATPSHHQKK